MSRLRCLQDFAVNGLDALVECGNPNCRRRVVSDPRELIGKIRKERWLHYLDIQCRHLRCGRCGHKGARIAPVPRILGPLDCPEFQADIDALWERVMAGHVEGEEQPALFQIEGPDEDGCVWICSAEGRDVWCQNLGPLDPVLDVLAGFLAQHDYEERGAFPAA